MTNSHPKEKEIQDYVLDRASCPASIIGHIESCAACQEEAKSYKLLFTELKQQPALSFDFNVSELLMPMLPSREPLMTTERFIFGFLVVFSCLCICIPVYIFWQNILYLFNGIPVYFIYVIIGSSVSFLMIKIQTVFKKYQNQIRILNFNYSA